MAVPRRASLLLVACIAALAFISAIPSSHAVNLLGSWQSQDFNTAFPGYTLTGPVVAIANMPDPVHGQKYANLASGEGNNVQQLSQTSETFMGQLFDAVVTRVRTSNCADPDCDVNAHSISWCNSFHAHTFYNANEDDYVWVFHNREYCAAAVSEVNTCRADNVWKDVLYAGFLAVCDMAADFAPTGYCASHPCKGGFDKHLMVYSSKDKKIYYWDTYANYLAAFHTLKDDSDTQFSVSLGGLYKQVFATPADWERLPDVNVHIDSGAKKVWARGNAFDRVEAVNAGRQAHNIPPPPPKPPVTQVFVQGVGPNTLVLDVTGATKVGEVLVQAVEKVKGKKLSPEEKQKVEAAFYLVHQGKVAPLDKTLAEAKVEQHGTLRASVRAVGGSKQSPKQGKLSQSQVSQRRQAALKTYQMLKKF